MNLDDSVPLDPRQPPLSTLSTVSEIRTSIGSDCSLQQHRPSPLPYHVPQHLIKEQLDLDRMHDEFSAGKNNSDDDTGKSNLLHQLHAIRQQRQHLKQNIFPALFRNLNEWDLRLSSSQQSHQIALSTLEALSARRIWAEEEYQVACKWHVLGDVFFIWHRGPFGTINGFRLGKSAVTMVGLVKKCAGGSNRNGTQGTGQGGSGGGASLFSWGASENGTATSHASPTKSTNNGVGNVTNSNAAPEKVILPWNEINSALGQVVFLLYTLQNTPYSGISFRKHILQPCGSVTKIGVLKRQVFSGSAPAASSSQHPRNERRRITALAAYYHPGTPDAESNPPLSHQMPLPAPLPGEVTWYNLHHYEENGSLLSMGYYARRNFNTALEGLLHCIAEACFVVEKRNMALAAPYVMRVGGLVVGKDVHGISEGIDGGAKEGEASVGGLPLAYDPMSGEQWTMVCKYFLTNLKWLVAYAAKHVDR